MRARGVPARIRSMANYYRHLSNVRRGGEMKYVRSSSGAQFLAPAGLAAISAVNVPVDPTAPKPWYADALTKIAETASATITANRIAKTNAERLARGLPPLTDSEIRRLAPAANVQVQLPGEVKALLWIGGGAIVALTLGAVRRRRR